MGFFVSFDCCCEVFVALYTSYMLCGVLPFANICVYLSKKKATLKNGHSYESTEKIVKSSLRNVGTESLGRSKIDKSLSWQGLLVSLLAKDSSTDR